MGPDDPNVVTVLENMAQLYRELGEKEEAIRLDERARAIRATTLAAPTVVSRWSPSNK